jgi:hypothetical protein
MHGMPRAQPVQHVGVQRLDDQHVHGVARTFVIR